MSIRSTLRGPVAAVAAVLVLAACAPSPHEALEPLRGPGTDEAEVAPATEEVTAPELDVNGAPLDIAADAPAGFGEVPLDEMELPPDAPPPPIEGGSAPVTPIPEAPPVTDPPAPPSEPSPVVNPPPSTPIPSGGSGGVAAATDYCGLWSDYGSVMAAVDSAIYSGSGVPAALGLAAEVHDRAAELDSGLAGDHRRVANAMRVLESLLGSYGYDVERLITAVDADSAVAARFEATQVDDSLDRTTQAVLDRCGVNLI